MNATVASSPLQPAAMISSSTVRDRSSFWKKRIFWNITFIQFIGVAGFYLFFGFMYWLALQLTSDFKADVGRQILINYFLKAFWTLPVYWLVLVKMKTIPIWKRLITHLVTLPLYIIVWLKSYHWTCELLGEGYLWGYAVWWDVYIPFLFYIVQFGVFHIYEYYLQVVQGQVEREKLSKMALESEVRALKAQIQPHFLFNTLNSISASVPREMENTRELIAQLADTFRFALKGSEQEWVNLEEELHFIETYLLLEKRRFSDKLTIRVTMEDACKKIKVPPMLLQPLVENAVKHGIEPCMWSGEIVVAVTLQKDSLRFEISDTGVGFDGPIPSMQAGQGTKGQERGGLGLRNTQHRIFAQFGESLTISEHTPSGVKVEFSLPLQQLPHGKEPQ